MLIAAGLGITVPLNRAWAQSIADEAVLSEVRVDARPASESASTPVIGYRARHATTATKTDTPLAETPQSVTVITQDAMADQGAHNLQDALNYAAGVRSDAYGLDSRGDSVRVRGAYPDNYIDGLREAYGYYTSRARPDPFTLERIEVLRGPAGMLFGAGTVAGVINMVSKKPQTEAQGEIGLQWGSFGRKQGQFDLTGPLNNAWSYRLVGVARQAHTQVDYVPDNRGLLMPALTWRPSAATSLTLQGLWQQDRTASTAQFLPWYGTILPNPNGYLPSSRFIGEPGDYYDTERTSFGLSFEHRFSDAVLLRHNLRSMNNANDSLYHYANSFSGTGGWDIDPQGQRVVSRSAIQSQTRTRILASDTHVQSQWGMGAVRHTLLSGLDFSRQHEDTSMGSTISQIDAYVPVYGDLQQPIAMPQPSTYQRQMGFYLQDQMQWERWRLTIGLRHDRAVDGIKDSPSTQTSATTKRLGLMHVWNSGWTPYVSYAESFTPQPAQQGTVFKPLRGEQWEAGVKYEPAGRSLAFAAAVYDLREKNQVAQPQPNIYTQLGQTRTRGLELEAKGSPMRQLDLVAHYNFTQLDAQLEGLPPHQASIWATYRLAIAGVPGFTIGAGARWMGAFTDRSYGGVGPEVPAVALLDLMLAYDQGPWRYALNVRNATDKTYFSTCLTRGDCWFGARRNAVLSATYRF